MSVAAVVQMTSVDDVDANLYMADKLIDEAVSRGASLVVLPENFSLMPQNNSQRLEAAQKEGQKVGKGKVQNFLAKQAGDNKICLIGGTTPVLCDNKGKVRSACFAFNESGELLARYDKAHLFDVKISETERYSESDYIEAGDSLSIINTPCGRTALTVCYDMRFPEMFRRLSSNGADLFTVPSAFTVPTGHAHWELLLRARAVENLGYVLAPAQVGIHPNGRETYGHSMIVDPWGKVLASLEQGGGVVTAEIDLAQLEETRRRFPALSHRRLDIGGVFH